MTLFQNKFKFGPSLKKLAEQVIVITGATSGIGLSTALRASKQGARLVLVSRNEAALAETQQKVENMGGECVYVVADVGQRGDVEKISKTAIEAYGGFDTWVNCAGVGMLGKLEDVSDEDSRRLFDTNYWGIVYGSMAAVKHLKYKGGAIINLGSLLSDMSMPLQGMYCASKHAIKGFTDSLRHELEADNSPVCLTLIKPAAIATPFFSHSKNYTSQQAKAPLPVYAPEEVAYAILHAAQNRVRDVRVGGASAVMAAMNAHAPKLMDFMSAKFMAKAQLSNQPKARDQDNLHGFGQDGNVYGRDMPIALNSIYTRAVLNPAMAGAALAVAGLAAYALFGRKASVYTKFSKTALKGMNAGLNILGPLQNAVIAKTLMKFVESKLHETDKSLRRNGKTVGKAVNENTRIIKKKALSFIK